MDFHCCRYAQTLYYFGCVKLANATFLLPQKNSVIGFDLTVGEFYNVRGEFDKLLRQNNMYLKNLHTDVDAKFDACDIWKQLSSNFLLSKSNCPEDYHDKWRFDMLWKFISATSQWTKKHITALDQRHTPDKGWTWGPDRVTPKNAYASVYEML